MIVISFGADLVLVGSVIRCVCKKAVCFMIFSELGFY